MSTGMTEPEGQRVLDQALFEGIFKRDYRTLGRAISYAKQELVANSVALGEMGKTFLLFGDPAMRLKVPLPTAPVNPTGQVSGSSVTLTWGASTDANGASCGWVQCVPEHVSEWTLHQGKQFSNNEYPIYG